MKKIIALAAILSSTSVLATSELEFGDVNYFIKQNQFNVRGDVITSSFVYRSPDTAKQVKTEGYTFQTSYGYGILNNLNVYLGLDYAYRMKTTNPGSSKIDNDGLRNPSLAANYRLINQNDAAVNFDIGVLARMNVQDAERGASASDSVKDGNAADGRNSYELNVAVGRKWNEANEWRAGAGYRLHTSGDYKQLVVGASSNTVDVDSSNDFFAFGTYQYRPVQEMMFTLTGTALRAGETTYKEAGSKTVADSHMVYDFMFNAKYLVTSNFIVKFTFGQGNNPDYDTKVAGVKKEIKRQHSQRLGLGVDFLF